MPRTRVSICRCPPTATSSVSFHAHRDRPFPPVSARGAKRLGPDGQELSRRLDRAGRLPDRRPGRPLPRAGPTHASLTCAATWRRCMRRATRKRRSPGGWLRCGASSASANAKAGPRPIRPSRCAIRARVVRCRIFSPPKTSAACCWPRPPTSRWACATARSWRRCTRPACA